MFEMLKKPLQWTVHERAKSSPGGTPEWRGSRAGGNAAGGRRARGEEACEGKREDPRGAPAAGARWHREARAPPSSCATEPTEQLCHPAHRAHRAAAPPSNCATEPTEQLRHQTAAPPSPASSVLGSPPRPPSNRATQPTEPTEQLRHRATVPPSPPSNCATKQLRHRAQRAAAPPSSCEVKGSLSVSRERARSARFRWRPRVLASSRPRVLASCLQAGARGFSSSAVPALPRNAPTCPLRHRAAPPSRPGSQRLQAELRSRAAGPHSGDWHPQDSARPQGPRPPLGFPPGRGRCLGAGLGERRGLGERHPSLYHLIPLPADRATPPPVHSILTGKSTLSALLLNLAGPLR
ncbi:uncharacterized protein LOC118532607 [Halichoerus grypus]